MPLGLGSNLSKTGLTTPGIVTDNLVLKHKYDAGSVVPVSDGAAYFDGTNDYIDLGDSNTFITGNNVTLAAWVKLTDTDRGYVIGNARASGSSNLSLSTNANEASQSAGYITVIVRLSSSTVFVKYDGNIDDNKWHHIAFTTSNSAQALYLDGVLVATGSNAFSNSASTEHMLIGNLDSQSLFFGGYIANAAIWSSVLTQPQIKSIMNKNYAGLTDSEKTNLVSWWNLDSAYDIDDTTESTETTQYVFDNHHGGGDTLGSDVMAGGDMSSDSGWNLDSGWSISNGKLVCETSSFNTAYKTTSGLTEGKLYKVTVDVATTNGNPLLIYLGEGHSGSVTANVRGRTQTTGTNVFYLVAGATNQIYFYAGSVSARWNGTIDNVIIQEVNGNHGVLS